MASKVSRIRFWLWRCLLAGLVSALSLALAVVLGAWIPVNSSFQESEEGITISLRSSPIHTDLILPVKTSVWNWDEVLDRQNVRTPNTKWDHVVLGWGSRTFFLETRTWADVKAVNVAKAFFGLDAAAMHVEWGWAPQSLGPEDRSLTLSPEQYEKLCRAVLTGFRLDEAGAVIPISAAGYGDNDRFYEGTNRYTFYRTCNTWTGQKLAEAGVRIGIWTPTPWSVRWQLPTERSST